MKLSCYKLCMVVHASQKKRDCHTNLIFSILIIYIIVSLYGTKFCDGYIILVFFSLRICRRKIVPLFLNQMNFHMVSVYYFSQCEIYSDSWQIFCSLSNYGQCEYNIDTFLPQNDRVFVPSKNYFNS